MTRNSCRTKWGKQTLHEGKWGGFCATDRKGGRKKVKF